MITCLCLLASAASVSRPTDTSLPPRAVCCAAVQPGIQFQDVTTILLDPAAFKHTVDLLTERYCDQKVDVIAGKLLVRQPLNTVHAWQKCQLWVLMWIMRLFRPHAHPSSPV